MTTPTKKIAILGGGISGLSCTWYLKKKWQENADISLFEASNRLGGWIQTVRKDNFLFELGPKSLRLETPSAALPLIEELGLRSELITSDPAANNKFLLVQNQLQKMPTGLFSMMGNPLTRSTFFAFLKEAFIKRGVEEDESVASFFSRRFSKEFAEQFIDPLVSGIYAGNMHELSMRSSFGKLWEDEKVFGSLFMGMLRQFFKPKGVGIVSLKRGLGSLIERLGEKLKDCIHLDTPVLKVSFNGNKVAVALPGQTIFFDKVISALPASKLAEILPPEMKLTALLKQIKGNSVTSVHLGYSTSELKVKGFGYLVPRKEKQDILGVVFDSAVFPEHNGLLSETRLTVMVGGETGQLGDEAVQRLALNAIKDHLGLEAKPKVCFITRAAQAIPQYAVGHFKQLKDIQSELLKTPSLSLTGNSYKGVSLENCLSLSRQAVEEN